MDQNVFWIKGLPEFTINHESKLEFQSLKDFRSIYPKMAQDSSI